MKTLFEQYKDDIENRKNYFSQVKYIEEWPFYKHEVGIIKQSYLNAIDCMIEQQTKLDDEFMMAKDFTDYTKKYLQEQRKLIEEYEE